jgi:hypothetical protein
VEKQRPLIATQQGVRSSFAAMKKLMFLGACLVALASQPVMAQTGTPEVIVVRISETLGIGGIHLVIIRPDGKGESVDVTGVGMTEKKLIESGQAYQRVFAKLYQEGYSLKAPSLP